jgi:hypothetical protein
MPSPEPVYLPSRLVSVWDLLPLLWGLYTDRKHIDAFTINAVAQDEFEDVKVPPAPAQALRAGASTATNGPVVR